MPATFANTDYLAYLRSQAERGDRLADAIVKIMDGTYWVYTAAAAEAMDTRRLSGQIKDQDGQSITGIKAVHLLAIPTAGVVGLSVVGGQGTSKASGFRSTAPVEGVAVATAAADINAVASPAVGLVDGVVDGLVAGAPTTPSSQVGGTKSELALALARFDTTVRARAAGLAGDGITVEVKADSGLGVGVTIEEVALAVIIHFEDGVSTVLEAETAIGTSSTLIEVKTPSVGGGGLAAPGDVKAQTPLAGGADGATTINTNISAGFAFVNDVGKAHAAQDDFSVHAATALLANNQDVYVWIVEKNVGGAVSTDVVKGTPGAHGAAVIPDDAAITAAVGAEWIKLCLMLIYRHVDTTLTITFDTSPMTMWGGAGAALINELRTRAGEVRTLANDLKAKYNASVTTTNELRTLLTSFSGAGAAELWLETKADGSFQADLSLKTAGGASQAGDVLLVALSDNGESELNKYTFA